MAYSVITTPVTGTTISTTAFGVKVKDNFDAAFPLGVAAWTAYTPTLTQSATVTKTVTYANYQRVGRLIFAQVYLTVTGAGTAANAIVIGLPVAVARGGTQPFEVGTATVFDSSANLAYKGNVILTNVANTTAVWVRASGTSTNVLGAADFTAALASGDTVAMTIQYEAAS